VREISRLAGKIPAKNRIQAQNRVGIAVKTPRYQIVRIIDTAYRRHHNREFRRSISGKNRRNREITGKLAGSPGPKPSKPAAMVRFDLDAKMAVAIGGPRA
jgi:hypothetical protein